jgi:hypothetical protein
VARTIGKQGGLSKKAAKNRGGHAFDVRSQVDDAMALSVALLLAPMIISRTGAPCRRGALDGQR